ncbi:MAG TPA: YbhB/YbcL family Raf kinase inhibitor-like protein [bacterium]|nr:YbhB/YbcL family Raf kinase inhibitor-like protein [bacterium]
MPAFRLFSPAFANEGSIPVRYTGDGEDVSPPLEISGIPAGTASLVLIVDDPDAPGGSWEHLILFNIPPGTEKIGEGEIPEGAVRGKNSFGILEYGGPAPPSGTHRYFFKLYALYKKLSLQEGSFKGEIEKAMAGHILAQASLMGKYKR